MKIKITKQWQELPYTTFTATIPSVAPVHFSSSTDSSGIPFMGTTKQFYAEGALYARIDPTSMTEFVDVEVENFI